MKNPKNKSKISTIALILTLMATTLIAGLPVATAQTTISLSPKIYAVIGINSPTLISWLPSPNLLFDPPYADQTYVWPDATVTFTRPDDSTDIVSGPFKTRFTVPGDDTRRDVVLVYTPDMMGTWTVNFTWPGDDTYAPVTQVNGFYVGEHFPKREGFAMLSLRPYPAIGLGQFLLVNAWVTPPPFTLRDNFEDYTFTIKKPNGTTAYQFTMDTEMGGYVWWEFVFDTLGDWTITFEAPGDHITSACSVTQTITVQEDPIPYPVEDTPLPTDEWTFPVNVYNREWRNIAGPWYESYYNASGGSWNPYTEAPRSAHILWKADPVSGVGGYVGATAQSPGITTPSIYASTNVNIRTVMAGRGYYTAAGMIHCVDIFTGEELWSVPGRFNVGATRGRNPVLYQFGSTFRVYDALTGAVTLEVPGMSMTYWDDPYAYFNGGGIYDMALGDWVGGYVVKWDTTGTTTNFTARIVWNATFPCESPSASHGLLYNNLIINRVRRSGDILCEKLTALNLTTGEIEYDTQIADRTDPSTWVYRQGPAIGAGHGLVSFAQIPTELEGLGYTAYYAATGELAWFSEQTDYPWGNFYAYRPQAVAYNLIYGLSYAGVYAFNATNGEVVWYYSAGDAGMETPYNTWPFGSTGPVVGGGIVFAPNTEHSPTHYYRGEQLHAIDAFTGDKVWSIMGYYNPTAIAYGILLTQESPSGYTYAFGKGETTTTVSVSSKVVSKGSSVLIEGSVLDLSPAQEGTAAISDASMSAWMEYLHMQQPLPMDTTGVSVTLNAIDPNGNFIDIGTATSDTDGKYGFTWTPETEGKYRIVATFEGSNSYYASHATTYIGVEPAPSPAQPIEPEPMESLVGTKQTEPTEAPFITTEVAIIAAVSVAVVIGIAAFWALRKRQ